MDDKDIQKDLEFHDRMERYFEREMDETERAAFMEEIRLDAEWMEQFEMERDLRSAARLKNDPALRQQRDQLQQEAAQLKQTAKAHHRKLRILRWAGGTGLVAIAAALGIAFAFSKGDAQAPPPPQTPPIEELALPYPIQVNIPNDGSAYALGLRAYFDKDWTDARTHLERAADTKADKSIPLLLLASVYTYTHQDGGDPFLALDTLDSLEAVGGRFLEDEREAITYFRALALIYAGEWEQGMDTLNALGGDLESDFVQTQRERLRKAFDMPQ